MSAIVLRNPPGSPRPYRAWCEMCDDGVNATKRPAHQWATQHNDNHHVPKEAP